MLDIALLAILDRCADGVYDCGIFHKLLAVIVVIIFLFFLLFPILVFLIITFLFLVLAFIEL